MDHDQASLASSISVYTVYIPIYHLTALIVAQTINANSIYIMLF